LNSWLPITICAAAARSIPATISITSPIAGPRSIQVAHENRFAIRRPIDASVLFVPQTAQQWSQLVRITIDITNNVDRRHRLVSLLSIVKIVLDRLEDFLKPIERRAGMRAPDFSL
jgi:hypothetical protein